MRNNAELERDLRSKNLVSSKKMKLPCLFKEDSVVYWLESELKIWD